MKEGKVYLAHCYWRFQLILGWIQGREAHGREQQFMAAEQQQWQQREDLSLFLIFWLSHCWDKYPTPKVKEGKVNSAHSYWRIQSILGWLQGRLAHGREQQFIVVEQEKLQLANHSNRENLSLCLSYIIFQAVAPGQGGHTHP